MKLTSEQLGEYLLKMKEKAEAALSSDIIIHGYMIYRCQECGSIYVMWLEKGLEDPTSDQNGGQHKPVPFGIVCPLCGGNANHIYWNATSDTLGKSYRSYKEYTNSSGLIYENFFWNDPDSPHGVPIILGEDYRGTKEEDVMDRVASIRMINKRFFGTDIEKLFIEFGRKLQELFDSINKLFFVEDGEEESDPSKIVPNLGNREFRRHGKKGNQSYKRSRSNKKMYEY